MSIKVIGKTIVENLPGVIRQTPYSSAVLVILGFAFGLWLG
jgi:hypothetical protein